jgi:hypothetical protein
MLPGDEQMTMTDNYNGNDVTAAQKLSKKIIMNGIYSRQK